MKVGSDHWVDTAVRRPIKGGSSMGTRRFLVMHFTCGATAQSSIDFWNTPKAKGANAHFVIDRDGTLYQCRPCNRTAGHAGKSKWVHGGRTFYNLNSCSIGIEFANAGDEEELALRYTHLPLLSARHKNGGPLRKWERYTDAQIQTGKELAIILCERYHLDDIVGHDDIAPDRKNDPGPAFPMEQIKKAALG